MANTTNKGAAAKQTAASNDNEVKELKEMLAQKDKETDELKDMIKQLSEIVKMTQVNNVQTAAKDDLDDIADLVYITNNSVGKQIITTDRLGQNSIIIKPEEKNRPIERDYIKQAMELGACGFVIKPFSPEQVETVVAEVLGDESLHINYEED